ncbi:hypothetical protein BYT27DRAFT_7206096 [Phlegmacium glaucopus]|nr:hypothetical protein BYT27DRAFT_7206096 [Phlegmacium glaucopus]
MSEEEMSMSSQGEEDEEEVNETEKRKGKRKENKASSFSIFSNTSAQWAAPVNIHLQHVQMNQSEDSSMATETSSCVVLHPWEHIKWLKKFQQIFSNDKIDEENPVVHKRPTKKKLYPQSSLCRYHAMRATRLTAIRELMNWLMNITADAEIHKVDCITEEDADNFEDNQTVGPELDPMCLYLNTSKHTRWNDKLSELFVERFQEEKGVVFTKKDRDMVRDMFLACLGWLSCTWQEYWTLSQEGQEKKRQRTMGLA